MKNLLTMPCLALALLASACSSNLAETTIPETENSATELHIDMEAWSCATRAEEELLKPVTILLVPEGGSVAIKRKVFEEGGDDINIEVPNGSYEIFAVCGLLEENVPDDLFEQIIVPPSTTTGNSLTDFAVGSAKISNEYGNLSSSSVTITAKRQMAWLTMRITNIPEDMTLSFLYIKCLGSSYNLADGWTTPDNMKNKFIKSLLGKKDSNNTISKDGIVIPCTEKTNGTEFQIVGTTTEGKTLTYKYVSTTPMISGKQLILNLSVSELSLVSETISTEGWDSHEENGTLTNPTVE